jgi:threonine dehydrogenase-like Zn-dependent dehydrogenase
VANAFKTSDLRIRAEAFGELDARRGGGTACAVGRLVEADETGTWEKGDRVLIGGVDAHTADVEASSIRCVRVPDGMETADALLIPPTAQALRVWRRLRLEIGETAIYSDGDGLTSFVALIATWRGAVSVIRLTRDHRAGDAESVNVSDALKAVERLRALVGNAPGLAAVDLSGHGETISMLLEAMPRWGRLLLAGPHPEPFTTAFYTDIHRKGVVVTGADLDSMFSNPSAWHADIRNACRLLMDPKRAVALRACAHHRSSIADAIMNPGREPDASRSRS